MKPIPLSPIVRSLRPTQWIKNSLVFTAIAINGQLLNYPLTLKCFWGFLIFCALSSASYILNDLIDYRYDRLHPQKKHRPLASGNLSRPTAKIIIASLALTGLGGSFQIDLALGLLGLAFLIIHVLYSTILKKFAVLDILAIASSFIIRTFAGEVLSGFHVPIWLMLTLVFLSLLIATGKRRSELVSQGTKSRPALESYRIQMLDVFNSTFATAALISYSLFTFFLEPPKFSQSLTTFLTINFPKALGRKWLMAATIPFIIVSTMRYFQLTYEKKEGEAPEKLLASDPFLFSTIIGWGVAIILIIYVF